MAKVRRLATSRRISGGNGEDEVEEEVGLELIECAFDGEETERRKYTEEAFRARDAMRCRVGRAQLTSGRSLLKIRITSYNVCYTKLLRSVPMWSRTSRKSAVITSYSIHYTKLYDLGPVLRPRPLRRSTGSC